MPELNFPWYLDEVLPRQIYAKYSNIRRCSQKALRRLPRLLRNTLLMFQLQAAVSLRKYASKSCCLTGEIWQSELGLNKSKLPSSPLDFSVPFDALGDKWLFSRLLFRQQLNFDAPRSTFAHHVAVWLSMNQTLWIETRKKRCKK